MVIIEMGSRQRPQLQHRLGPGLQIQTQAQSLHNPNPKPNSKLGLAKTKHKLGLALAQAQQDFIFFPVPSGRPMQLNFRGGQKNKIKKQKKQKDPKALTVWGVYSM